MITLQNEVTVEVVPLDEEFDVVVESGTPPVTSVNGEFGDISLSASDVGADAAGAAANALLQAKAYTDTALSGSVIGGITKAPLVYTQSSPSAEWVVVHNRGYYPSVTVRDSAGQQVEPSVYYPNVNTVRIVAGAPFSGSATLV